MSWTALTMSSARLDQDSALSHLWHFCRKIKPHPGLDDVPRFNFTPVDDSQEQWSTVKEARSELYTCSAERHAKVFATVTLPPSVPVQVREASSKMGWRTEKAARKDAAFHACGALYNAGLLNDNLLPLCQSWHVNEGLDDNNTPVHHQIESPNLWLPATSSDEWYSMELRIDPVSSNGFTTSTVLAMHTHRQVSAPPVLELHWDTMISFRVSFGTSQPFQKPSLDNMLALQNITASIYRAPRPDRHWHVDDNLMTLFEPKLAGDHLAAVLVGRSAPQLIDKSLPGLVRIISRNQTPQLIVEWTEHNQLVCTRFSKRRNFTMRTSNTEMHCKPLRTEVFAADDCIIESCPIDLARVGLFMPDLIQHIHDYMIVDELMSSVLHGMSFIHRDLARTAITAPSAQRLINYQRLEFIGDGVLKFHTSCFLFSKYLGWPEGYLTQRRSYHVCNATLASAAALKGIGRYIITEPVDYRNWTLPSARVTSQERQISSKTLADVIEALIGAKWLEEGLTGAAQCIHILLPDLPATSQPCTINVPDVQRRSLLEPVESLIDYRFNTPGLLFQALTHPSQAAVSKHDSYERLEYLGDAVLDMVVTETLAQHIDKLSQGRMTQIKAALVNADLLGYQCISLKRQDDSETTFSKALPEEAASLIGFRPRSLAEYLIFHPDLAVTHQSCLARHQQLQKFVQQELDTGSAHPWSALEEMSISKMFSDMIESLIGAIFIDSGGDLNSCRSFCRHLGLLQYADRVIEENVDVRKPTATITDDSVDTGDQSAADMAANEIEVDT